MNAFDEEDEDSLRVLDLKERKGLRKGELVAILFTGRDVRFARIRSVKKRKTEGDLVYLDLLKETSSGFIKTKRQGCYDEAWLTRLSNWIIREQTRLEKISDYYSETLLGGRS